MKFITPTYLFTTTFVTALLLNSSNGAHLRRTTSISTSTNQLYCGSTPCTTLDELTQELLKRVPRQDELLYAAPNPTQINDWKSVVKSMLIADPRCESIPIPDSLKEAKYNTTRLTDEDNYDYCVLAAYEAQPYGIDGEQYTTSPPYPWGTVIVRLRKNGIDFTKVSIDIPHPLSDSGSYAQGTYIFKNSNAKTLLLAGSHRYTNGKGENSPKSDCDSRYNEADVAHGTNNMFHAAVEEIDNYWSEKGGYTAIQFHGMGKDTCSGVDAFFSDGNQNEASSSGNELRNNFETSSNFNEGTLKLINEAECKMNGTRNIQGRFLNGVSKSELCRTESEGGIFSTEPTSYSGKFLQIEQKENIRNKQYYKAWAEAVTNSFPSY